jgi:hypothetical protein
MKINCILSAVMLIRPYLDTWTLTSYRIVMEVWNGTGIDRNGTDTEILVSIMPTNLVDDC